MVVVQETLESLLGQGDLEDVGVLPNGHFPSKWILELEWQPCMLF